MEIRGLWKTGGWCPGPELNQRHADFQSLAIEAAQGLSSRATVKPATNNQRLAGESSNPRRASREAGGRRRRQPDYTILPPPTDDPFAGVAVYADAPEHYQRIVTDGGSVTRFAGNLAPRVIDLLEHIVGEGDIGVVVSAADTDSESFAVLRLKDWQSIERARA